MDVRSAQGQTVFSTPRMMPPTDASAFQSQEVERVQRISQLILRESPISKDLPLLPQLIERQRLLCSLIGPSPLAPSAPQPQSQPQQTVNQQPPVSEVTGPIRYITVPASVQQNQQPHYTPTVTLPTRAAPQAVVPQQRALAPQPALMAKEQNAIRRLLLQPSVHAVSQNQQPQTTTQQMIQQPISTGMSHLHQPGPSGIFSSPVMNAAYHFSHNSQTSPFQRVERPRSETPIEVVETSVSPIELPISRKRKLSAEEASAAVSLVGSTAGKHLFEISERNFTDIFNKQKSLGSSPIDSSPSPLTSNGYDRPSTEMITSLSRCLTNLKTMLNQQGISVNLDSNGMPVDYSARPIDEIFKKARLQLDHSRNFKNDKNTGHVEEQHNRANK